jgi:outer membrane biosynthesis protein TonB
MKAGLATSVALHAAMLGVGLFTLSAPRAFEVADVEALPVDIIPVDALTQIQEGQKEAPKLDKPAPTPTKRPDTVEDATKVGEADQDQEAPPTPEAKPRPVEQASEPPPAPKPVPKPVEKPVEEPKVAEAKPQPAPEPEREPEAQPRQEVTPEPTSEPLVAENPVEESLKLPDSAPVPQARPQPPKPQTAKAPERQKAEEKPAQQQAQKSEKKESEVLDQVAALLNKEKASGGGAKRSQEQASLGGESKTAGEKLTQSEMDALRGQIQRCWNVPAGALDAENLRVSVKFKLDPSGAVEGSPEIISGGSGSTVERAAAASARRAILQCAPYNLPADKYSAWADVIVNFDPSDMF